MVVPWLIAIPLHFSPLMIFETIYVLLDNSVTLPPHLGFWCHFTVILIITFFKTLILFHFYFYFLLLYDTYIKVHGSQSPAQLISIKKFPTPGISHRCRHRTSPVSQKPPTPPLQGYPSLNFSRHWLALLAFEFVWF